jgi:hypothetical protein
LLKIRLLDGRSYSLQVVADTVIDGKMCKKLTGGNGCAALSNQTAYLYFDAQKVYQYSPNQKRFYLLYNWSAQLNEVVTSYYISGNTIDSFKYRIDSIGIWTPNGEAIKVMKISYLSVTKTRFATNYILEKMGANAFFFPQLTNCSPVQWGSIRCFVEPNKTPVKFVNYPCDSIVSAVSASNIVEYKPIKLFPTTASGSLNIDATELNAPISEAYFSDLTGRLVLSIPNIKTKQLTLDVSEWKSGLYILTLTTEKGETRTAKFFKMTR